MLLHRYAKKKEVLIEGRGFATRFRVYEELNSNGIFCTFWNFFRNFRYMLDFFEFYVHSGIFFSDLLLKISEFLVHPGENFGIFHTFWIFIWNFSYILNFFGECYVQSGYF